jgi:anti-sigma-K factor RskA
MSGHDTLRELAGPYALDILSDDDRRAFEPHLPLCAECQREVADARAVAEGLAHTIETVDPPAALRARVLEAATATANPPTLVGVRPSPAGVFPWWLAAAASVAAIVSGLGWWNAEERLARTEAALQAARQTLAVAQSQMAAAQSVADRVTGQLDVVSAGDAVRVDLKGQPAAPAAGGRVYWSRSRGTTFIAANLPPLDAGRVYQLWFVTTGPPVSAALVTPDAAGRFETVVPSPAGIEPTAFALTVEPAGGSPGPTGAMLLVGAR